MTAQRVRSNYVELEKIASTFGQQADSTNTMLRSLKQHIEQLRGGDWIGKGATAFYREMDNDLLPTVKRLYEAMNEAKRVTLQVRGIMAQAEADASRILDKEPGQGGGNTGGDGGPGGTGGAGDSGGGIFNPTGQFSPGGSYEMEGGAFSKFKLKLFEGSLFSKEFGNGVARIDALGGEAGLGILRDKNGKLIVGGYAEVYAAKFGAKGTVLGDKDFGLSAGVEAKALSAEAFAGYRDGSVGAEVGVNLGSVKGEVGVNVLGGNVSVGAEIGWKLELGLSVGKKTEVKLGPVSFSLNFGGWF